MATAPETGVELTYQYAQRWKEICMCGDGSILEPGRELWTEDLLAEFNKRFVDNPLMDDRKFTEKFREQLQAGPPDLKCLAAEMLWLLYLFPRTLIKPATKCQQVREVWSWSGAPLPEDRQGLAALDHGMGNPGQGFNTYRWQELGFLWRLAAEFKRLQPMDQQRVFESPWSFVEWIDSLEDSDRRMLRHILPHLLFPDTFERIASGSHKRKIIESFRQQGDDDISKRPDVALSDTAVVDWKLLRIRRRLEGENPQQPLDFYLPPYRQQWKDDGSGPSPVLREEKQAWWEQFFDSNTQAHAAFDLFHEACIALGVEDTKGATAQRVSFTNTKSSGKERLRLNCGNTLVLEVATRSGHPNCSFIARVDEGVETLQSVVLYNTPYAGHMLGVYAVKLADLLEEKSIIRTLFINALGDVAATYKNIKNRHFEQAHRPRLLFGAFHREARNALFATGPTQKPSEELPILEVDRKYTKVDALRDLFMEEEDVDRAIAMLKRKKNIILQGAPGTGKTFVARRLAYLLMGVPDESRATMVQFHQSTCYEDFIQGYRPDGNGGFELKDGAFYTFCQDAINEPDKSFVFIIDEINRGNLSKIFGELMMLIESDKRDESFAVPLTYATSREETFYVPENVFLIGTMNTADRSLSMVDYALRRRFAFIEAEPGFSSSAFFNHLTCRGASPKLVAAIQDRMETINTMITNDSTNLGRGYRIGHSFFVPAKDTKLDAAWYRDIVRHEILPLIEEYWIDDGKARATATDILLQPIEP